MANEIVAPLPGIFYRRPAPDKPEYVLEGDEVKPGDVIGLIEIMKTFYEVKAEESGVVDKFLVNNEDTVEAGQQLLALK
ncbi:acetyl-CoA carboxylase [Calidifontibacillus oryziterrae]|uniref:acetyl-CoA carboxylase n=1 Tax=Calidifontibacillus oryziterrae TaxID=1191699 RepID=UPI0003199C92|nr:acetyl-CoA carboxylase [Calidifontibacillus oryziterrae]